VGRVRVKCNGKCMEMASVSANLSNPARRLARGPCVRMQREKIMEIEMNERSDRTHTRRFGVYTF